MSSNVNPPGCSVKLRGTSADFSVFGPQFGELDLGEMSAAQATELLEKFAAIDAVRLVDADPRVLVAGRRGRFTIRPGKDGLLLQETGQPDAAWLQLPPAAIAAWLDQSADAAAASGNTTPDAPIPVARPAPARRAPALALLLISAAAVVFSAWFTLRPKALYPDSKFTPIANAAEISRLQQQVIGRFATTDGSSELVVAPDGSLTYLEKGDSPETTEQTPAHYRIMLLTGAGPVLRTDELGPIAIRDTRTLLFNGEAYQRNPS
jgi:hypothetical protein